jgi:hypothetical protein
VKVTHYGEEHLLCLSSEEVALLLDLCHAGLYSDLLGHDRAGSLMVFIGEMQHSLLGTAQAVWQSRSDSAVAASQPATPPGGEARS